MDKIFSNTIRYVGVLLCVGVFLFAWQASAATLFMNPAESTQLTGSTASIDVYVDSKGAIINAVSGTIVYSSSILEPISITTEDSIVDLWVYKPAVEGKGKISFEGLIHNPGFEGTGKVATIRFRVLAEGQAGLSFSNGLVLANDGHGTNVLGSFADATVFAKKGGQGSETLPDTVAMGDVEVEDLVDRIRPPVVTQYSRSVAALNELFMQGITYPDAEVKVWLQRESEPASERSIASDAAGNFVYVHGRDGDGRDTLPSRVAAAAFLPFVKQHYYFWASVVRDGVESEATQLFDVTVGGIGGIDASPFAILVGGLVILLILAILGLLVYIVVRGRKMFRGTPPPNTSISY